MKHPLVNVEHYEYNLGKAPDLRCEYGTVTTTCDKCESCRLRRRIVATRQWFQRAGEKTRRTFLLGLVRRFHSRNLLRYTVSLLCPLLGKDFTYARSRTQPSVAGDGANTGDDRALRTPDIEQTIRECWKWFSESKYWTKANYLLGVLQMCNGELLHSVGTLARTMLASGEQTAQNASNGDDYEKESLADTVYSYTSETYPENKLLRTAGHEYSSSIPCLSDSSEYLDSAHIFVDVGEEENDSVSESETSSIDPASYVMPTSKTALVGVAQYRDFIRQLPVHLSKNILSYLEYADLVGCMNVSRHWAHIAKEVEEDLRMRQLLWEDVMLMQGSSAQGGNPVYANLRAVPVPRLVGDSRSVAPSDLPAVDIDFKSEINIKSSYSGIVTYNIQMEERNVYCGAYNVMVLSDQEDFNRVVSYNFGQLVAIGSFDRHVRFLDVTTGHDAGPVITGHAGSIRCLYINDRQGYVISGSFDTSIRCWDVKTGKPLRIFHGHQDTILCLAMAHREKGSLLVSGGKDCVVKVWNFSTGKCLRTFKHIHQVTAVAIHGDTVVSGCEGGRVKVWSIKDACLIKMLYQSPKNTNRFGFINPHTHQGPITSVKLDAWHIVSGSRDGYALVWSTVGDHKRCVTALRHPKEVLCLELSYLRVITGCEDGKLRIWNMLSGDCLRVMRGNSKSDPIEDIYPCGERLVLHTVNNLLVLCFEEVQWDYEQEEKIELLRYKNHYGDAPMRKHTYPYIRAQRSERAGACNPKIIRHQRLVAVGGRTEMVTVSTGTAAQLGHSARGLHASNLERAKAIQKQAKAVEFVSSLKGSVYHNVQGSHPNIAVPSGSFCGAGLYASSRLPTTTAFSRPHTALSKSTVGCASRPQTPAFVTGPGFGMCTSQLPTSIMKNASRPTTAFSTKSGVLKRAKFVLPTRGHSAPTRRHSNDALSLSEAKSLIRSQERTKNAPVPRDKLLLTINCIESSKKHTVLVNNTTANALEIDYKPHQCNSSQSQQAKNEFNSRPKEKSYRHSRAASPLESMNIHFQTNEFDNLRISPHPNSTPSTNPERAVQQPTKSFYPRPSSGQVHSAEKNDIVRRSQSANAILVKSNLQSAVTRKKTFHGWTTSHTEPIVTTPMLMHGPSRIDIDAQSRRDSQQTVTRTLMGPPVEVMDPLKSHKEFQIRTREQTEDYLNRVSKIQQKYVQERAAKAEILKRKIWLAKAKGQIHQDFSSKPRGFASEIKE